MSQEDVIVNMGVKEANLFRMWQESERRIKSLEKSMGSLNKTSSAGARKFKSDMDAAMQTLATYGARWLSVGAGIGAATGAMNMFISAQRTAITETQRLTVEYDKLFRKFSVQANLPSEQVPEARKKIMKVAHKYGLDPEAAEQGAEALVSGGFTPEQAMGGSLDALSEVLSSMGPVDPKEFTDALIMYLQSNRMPLNDQSIRAVGKAFSNLYSGTQLQPADLIQLAGEAAPLVQAGMSYEDQLAADSILRDVMPGDESATGLRNVTSRMQTIGASPEKVKWLSKLNLKPEDVNYSEGSWEDNMRRLKGGLDTVDKTTQAEFLKKVFEEKGQSAAKHLLDNIGKMEERRQLQRSKGYEQRVETQTSGDAAQENRLKIEKEETMVDQDAGGDAIPYGEAYDIEQMKRNRSPLQRDIHRKVYEWGTYLGLSPENAQRISEQVPDSVEHLTQPWTQVRDRVGPGPVRERTDSAKESSDKQEKLQQQGNVILQRIYDALVSPRRSTLASSPPPGLKANNSRQSSGASSEW